MDARLSLRLVVLLVAAAGVLAKTLQEKDDDRIINGKQAEAGELKYQVSLQSRDMSAPILQSSRKEHFCGGTLVLEGWVVTAAHCIRSHKYIIACLELQVVVGAIDLNDKNNPVYAVRAIHTHQPFTEVDFIGDVALLQLEPNDGLMGKLSDHPVELMPLVPEDLDFTGQDCLVSGWGHTQDDDKPNMLMRVMVEMQSQDNCAKMCTKMGEKNLWDSNTDSMKCAGGGDKDSCQGDSGGPLVCSKDGKSYLVGIVSFGYGCGDAGIPGIYTNVAKYKGWIDDVIAKADAGQN
ncbi:unnamed protein product [Sphagnum tenellum]